MGIFFLFFVASLLREVCFPLFESVEFLRMDIGNRRDVKGCFVTFTFWDSVGLVQEKGDSRRTVDRQVQYIEDKLRGVLRSIGCYGCFAIMSGEGYASSGVYGCLLMIEKSGLDEKSFRDAFKCWSSVDVDRVLKGEVSCIADGFRSVDEEKDVERLLDVGGFMMGNVWYVVEKLVSWDMYDKGE